MLHLPGDQSNGFIHWLMTNETKMSTEDMDSLAHVADFTFPALNRSVDGTGRGLCQCLGEGDQGRGPLLPRRAAVPFPCQLQH